MITVRDLDLMSYREKTIYFTRPDCWNPNGKAGPRLRLRSPDRFFNAGMDGGNITHTPPTIGRPCYGIMTAFLRYRDKKRFVRGRGQQPDTRCARCLLFKSCETVVRRRIRAHPELKDAHEAWLLAEGPTRFDHPQFDDIAAGRTWRKLCATAIAYPFTSTNDVALRAYYARQDAQRDAEDANRKRKAREANRRNGDLDDDHYKVIAVSAQLRFSSINEAQRNPGAPRFLKALPAQSIEDIRDVWHGREILSALKQKANAPNIARWINATGKRDSSASFAALCTRVHKDLKNIGRLERLIIDGRPVITPFTWK